IIDDCHAITRRRLEIINADQLKRAIKRASTRSVDIEQVAVYARIQAANLDLERAVGVLCVIAGDGERAGSGITRTHDAGIIDITKDRACATEKTAVQDRDTTDTGQRSIIDDGSVVFYCDRSPSRNCAAIFDHQKPAAGLADGQIATVRPSRVY